MRLNQTSERKVMTIWVWRKLPLLNFERPDILLAWIGHLIQKLWQFEFAMRFHVKFRASRYIMRLNRTSEWHVMTIWISWVLPFFNFKQLDILFAWIRHLSQKLWTFEFALRFDVYFWASWYTMRLNQKSEWKVMTIWISRELPLFNFVRLYMWVAWIGHPS